MKSTIHELQKSDSNIVSKTNLKNSRKRNCSLVVVALLIISVLNFSCSKPENGTNGKDGATGSTGATGTANVIYSGWLPVTLTANSSSTFRTGTILTPQISQDVLNKDHIAAYIRFLNFNNQVFSLNYIDLILNKYFYFYTEPEKIRLDTNFITGNFELRYIIIPGGVPAGRGTTPKLDYSQMTYSQVCAKFNIPE